jgi:hypothetical protein
LIPFDGSERAPEPIVIILLKIFPSRSWPALSFSKGHSHGSGDRQAPLSADQAGESFPRISMVAILLCRRGVVMALVRKIGKQANRCCSVSTSCRHDVRDSARLRGEKATTGVLWGTRAYLTILDTALDLCAVLDDVFDF